LVDIRKLLYGHCIGYTHVLQVTGTGR